MEHLPVYAATIDTILASRGTDSQRQLFDRYTALAHESDREAFVLCLIMKVIMQAKQLELANRKANSR